MFVNKDEKDVSMNLSKIGFVFLLYYIIYYIIINKTLVGLTFKPF